MTAAICLAGLAIASIHLGRAWRKSTKKAKLFIPLLTDSPQTPPFPLFPGLPFYVNAKIHSLLITDSGNEKQGKEHVLVTIGWSVLINSPN